MEFNSKGTKLSVATIPTSQSTEPSFKSLYGLYHVPELGGTPDKLDVTHLEDEYKRAINGLKDIGTIEFEFYATEDETDTTAQIRDTWASLSSYDSAETELIWKVEYPDGEGWTWNGKCSVRRQAVDVNSAIKFTLSVDTRTGLYPL